MFFANKMPIYAIIFTGEVNNGRTCKTTGSKRKKD